jgi:hypothetical protein
LVSSSSLKHIYPRRPLKTSLFFIFGIFDRPPSSINDQPKPTTFELKLTAQTWLPQTNISPTFWESF